MNAVFLKDLAAKTHRGLRGRVAEGKSAGGLSYGYAVLRQTDSRGEPIRGERTINATEAAVVRRIFEQFVAGSSPIATARTLNRDGIAGPRGQTWRDTTIRGHAGRGTGILRNELYVGRLVWNRMRFVKDPTTGKRVSRPNPVAQWVIEEVSALRIVDQSLWEQAQARLGAIRDKAGADHPDRRRFWEKRRPQHLLSGKLVCGVCGGTVGNIGRDYLACTVARRQDICSNRRTIRRQALERLVLDALRSELMQPQHVAEFVTEFAAEWNRLQAGVAADAAGCRRELATVERKLAGLIDAIADGLRAPGLQGKLDALETRRTELEQQLRAAPVAAPCLHPNLAEVYRIKVEQLQVALAQADDPAILEAVRALVERVVLHPGPGGRGFEVELIGEIAAMVGKRPASAAAFPVLR